MAAGGSGLRRVAKSAIDWAAFAERVPPNQIDAFRAFKARSEMFVSKYVAVGLLGCRHWQCHVIQCQRVTTVVQCRHSFTFWLQ